jgi:uncharacterized protein (TIGR02246 family)
LVQDFAAAWNAHDMTRFGALFAEDAEFVNVVGLWWHGRAQIQAAHAHTHATLFCASRVELAALTVRWPQPQLALARCRWELTGHVSPDGAPLPRRDGILVTVVQAHAGRWLIIDAQNAEVIEGVLSRPQ